MRVMGLKEETVRRIGFQRLAIFVRELSRAMLTRWHVAWLGHLIPGRFGAIEQDDIGRAFAADFVGSSASNGVVCLENEAMRKLVR